MHIQYLQDIMNIQHVIRSAKDTHLALRSRFWGGPWKAAAQPEITESQVQGILEQGWMPMGRAQPGIDILVAPRQLQPILTQIHKNDFVSVESIEPPLHKGLWWRLHVAVDTKACIACFCNSQGAFILGVQAGEV